MSASTKKKLRKEENAAKLTEKQLAEQKEAKKLKGYTLTFVIVIALVVVLAVGIMAVTAFSNSGIMEKNTDAVTIGEHTLSSAELNYFYIDAINAYYSEMNEYYGDYTDMYLSMMGLDTTVALDEQPYMYAESDETWADYFISQAVADATQVYAIYDQAIAAGHTVSEETEAAMNSNIAMLGMYASYYGYNNTEDYLQAIYGHGATEESFEAYMGLMAMTDSYQESYFNALTYDEADISAHSEENFDDYSSFDYCQYLVNVNDFIVCKDAENEEHEHTDEEISAAEKAAKAAADQIVASEIATADDLNEAINALDVFADAETAKVCAEYDGTVGSVITNEDVAAWLFEDARTAGDMTAIPYTITSTAEDGTETTSLKGYYVVLFLNRNDNNMNLVNVRHILASFEGGTTDETTGVTTYSEEEKKAALEAITAVKEQWLTDGGTEEAFTALVAENSDDTGSSAAGGLYEDVYPGQMVEAFNDWCFAEDRKTGDYEIVETEYGYHLIYFVSEAEVTFRNFMIENYLRNEAFNTWYTETTGSIEANLLNTKYLATDMVLSNG